MTIEQQSERMRAKVLLEAAVWRFAKTMAEIPHYYTLRKDWPDQQAFDFVVSVMRKYPTIKPFFGRSYKYFIPIENDEHQYWTMEREHETPILINRALQK